LSSTNPLDNWVTPELAANPGLAADVAKSPNPQLFSQPVSHAANTVTTADAIAAHANENGTQSFWSKMGAFASDKLSWFGKPLQEVQKDYKFIHSVYTNNGFLPGFIATLGVVGGGVAGGALGGTMGAALGADLAGMAERKLANLFPGYKKSLANSEDPNYKISAGRDLSNLVGETASAVGAKNVAEAFKSTDKGLWGSPGSFLSGITDAGADIYADPLSIIGRTGQLMRAGKLFKAGTLQVKYPILDSIPGVRNFIVESAATPINAEHMDALANGRGMFAGSASKKYQSALADMENIKNTAVAAENATKEEVAAGIIAAKYPKLGTTAAGRIADASVKDANDIHNYLKTTLFFGDEQGTLAGAAIVPQRTLLRAKLGEPVQDALKTNKITSGVYKTFSGYMPYSIDKVTGELSTKKFRWDAPDSASVIYRVARYGMGDAAAKEWAGQYALAVAKNDINDARVIKNRAYFESLKAAGLPDDAALVKAAKSELDKLDEPLASTQIYDVKPTGETIGDYMNTNGEMVSGGTAPHHAQEMWDIPDFFAVKKALREAGRVSKALSAARGAEGPTDLIGGLDEFLANRYTNAIFKPLALATTGFGLRVAAAEMIPAAARYGVTNMFKSTLASAAAKTNTEVIPAESKHIFAAAMSGLGLHMGIDPMVLQAGFPAFRNAKNLGLDYAARMLAPEQLDLATKLIIQNQGHILKDAVAAGHGKSASAIYNTSQAAHYTFQIHKNSALYKELPEWTTYSNTDINYLPRYAHNLNIASREAHRQNIASDFADMTYGIKKLQIEDDFDKMPAHQQYQDIRNKLIENEYNRIMATKAGNYKPYAAESKRLSRWIDQDPKAFATDRVDGTLGMLVGKDGTVLDEAALAMAGGKSLDFGKLKDLHDNNPQSLPAGVSGPILEEAPAGKNVLAKIADAGFKNVMDPIVNRLSREPLYVVHVGDAYKRMEPQIKAGLLTEDQALRIAQSQAAYSMMPQIHNVALRSQFAQLARNFLPFYFAQEQALKRAYATLKDTSIMSPAFSRGLQFYQLSEHALNDPAFMQTDDNGNKFITLPGVGYFGQAVQGALNQFGMPMVSGLPISGRGSMTSLKSVLPELATPGVSPILATSANIIGDMFPALQPVVKGTVGDIAFKKNIVSSLVPTAMDAFIPAAWLKTLISSTGISGIDFNNQFGNALAGSLAAAYYHNPNGILPDNANEYDLQAVVDRVKNNARSILMVKAAAGLLSPLAPQVSQEDLGFRDEFWKLVKATGNYGDALQMFLKEHGDRAVSYTVSKTENMVQGAKYPYVQQTVDFIKNNPQWFKTQPGNSNTAGAFWLIPQTSESANNRDVYNELLAMHLREYRAPKELLRQFYIAHGDSVIGDALTAHNNRVQQFKDSMDTYGMQQERQQWSQVMQKMQYMHPIWYANYTGSSGKQSAQEAYDALTRIFSEPNPPTHDQARQVYALMQDYQKHKANLAQYSDLGLRGGLTTYENQDWTDYLTVLAQKNPQLQPIIKSVFMKLG